MRIQAGLTAAQLGSVALRYVWPGPRGTNPLRRRSGRGSGGGVWSGRRESPGRAAGSGGTDVRLQRLEAVLFLARAPMSTRRLSQYANLADGTEARTLVRRLQQRCDEKGRAFRVEEVAGGFQLLTRSKFAPWLRRLEHMPPETRLSTPALETLSVVAYRQPVPRADIESVRGVGCGEILRQLMDRELVRISGRSHELGRPYLYSTTKRFLQLFGLASLEQLPRAEAMREASPMGPGNAPRPSESSRVSENGQQAEESQVSVSPPDPLRSDEALEQAPASSIEAPRQSVDDDDDDEDEEEYEYEEYEYDDDEEEDDEEEDEEEEDDEEYDEFYEEEEEEEDEDEDEDYEDEWEEVGEDEDEDEEWDDEELDWEEEEEEAEEEEEDWD